LVDYERVSNTMLRTFKDILVNAGFITTVRTTRGDDIDAACGQLAGTINDRTKRSARYRAAAEAKEEPVKIING